VVKTNAQKGSRPTVTSSHTATASARSARAPRSEVAAELLARLAEAAGAGVRMGSKSELRARCAVSVGTFNEALRIAASRGVVIIRPGPGGGLFAADQPPLVRLGNSVLALDADQTSVAEAVRIRDALDPLLIEDALWHASATDIADMRALLDEMARTAEANDSIGFVHANWKLHARIAHVSPQPILRSLYVNLLAIIESHTLSILPTQEQALPDFIAQRHELHVGIVDAIAEHDQKRALALVNQHNTSSAIHHDTTEHAADAS